MAARTSGGGVIYPAKADGSVLTTTEAGKSILAASFIKASQSEAKKRILEESKWRAKYGDHIAENVVQMAQNSEQCLEMADGGLNYIETAFRFERNGETLPLKQGFAQARTSPQFDFETYTVQGSLAGTPPTHGAVGFEYNGQWLTGNKMLAQLDKWGANGTIEKSVGKSIRELLAAGGSWTDLADQAFVVLGAGGAMCPTECLLNLGATVIAVDIPRPNVYERLIQLTLKSRGKLLIPFKRETKDAPINNDTVPQMAGADMLSNGPELTNWLAGLCLKKRLVVGSYAYADGALFIRVVAAMDRILLELCKSRPDTSWCYLCSPTDCFLAPIDAKIQADQLRGSVFSAGLMQSKIITSFLSTISGGKYYIPNGFIAVDDDGRSNFIAPEFVDEQGPNYALAKRIQHWRAMTLRRDGYVVSANIAPASKTVSVMKQKLLAAAYRGCDYYYPIEIFPTEVSNMLMTFIMLYDINSPTAAGNPHTPLANPLDIFVENACHNGFWRAGFALKSLVTPAAVVGLSEPYFPVIKITAALSAFIGLRAASKL